MEHLILQLLESRRGRVVVAILMTAIGLLFAWIAYPDFRDSRRLRRSTAHIDAQIVETRSGRGPHFEKEHDVRYRFRVPGRDQWFTHGERGTGRTDLWSSLDSDEWERARQSGRIWVAYVPDDPSINGPVSRLSAASSDVTAGLIIGLAMTAGGALWLGWIAGRWVVR
jgi:hypothetical protein